MSDPTTPPFDLAPDPEIASLLAAERAIPAAPASARERVYARVSATVGLAAAATSGATAAAGAASSAAARGSAVRLVATGLVGAVLGGGLIYLLMRGRPVVAPPPAVASAAPVGALVPAVPEAVVAPIAPVAALAPVPTPPTDAAPRSVRPRHPRARVAAPSSTSAEAIADSAACSLSAERARLDHARAALARGDGEESLATLRDDDQRCPDAQLAPERELLHVRVLAAEGATSQARARADAFRRRFPGSVYLPAVDATLRRLP